MFFGLLGSRDFRLSRAFSYSPSRMLHVVTMQERGNLLVYKNTIIAFLHSIFIYLLFHG